MKLELKLINYIKNKKKEVEDEGKEMMWQ